MSELVKIVVTVPEQDADMLRQIMGDAGAGQVGNYTHCSFSVKGVGRFLPQNGAHPTIGTIGKPESVIEDRIELTCERSKLAEVVWAIRQSHPYEEPAIDIYPLLDVG